MSTIHFITEQHLNGFISITYFHCVSNSIPILAFQSCNGWSHLILNYTTLMNLRLASLSLSSSFRRWLANNSPKSLHFSFCVFIALLMEVLTTTGELSDNMEDSIELYSILQKRLLESGDGVHLDRVIVFTDNNSAIQILYNNGGATRTSTRSDEILLKRELLSHVILISSP